MSYSCKEWTFALWREFLNFITLLTPGSFDKRTKKKVRKQWKKKRAQHQARIYFQQIFAEKMNEKEKRNSEICKRKSYRGQDLRASGIKIN